MLGYTRKERKEERMRKAQNKAGKVLYENKRSDRVRLKLRKVNDKDRF